MSKLFFVYILKCADNTLYTGYTTDLKKRIASHNAGSASKYTRSRLPVQMVYYEVVSNKSLALKREYEIKQLKRDAKQRLIDSRKNKEDDFEKISYH